MKWQPFIGHMRRKEMRCAAFIIILIAANCLMVAHCLQVPFSQMTSPLSGMKSHRLTYTPHIAHPKSLGALYMNLVPNYFDIKSKEDTESTPETSKKGIIRRVRDRISKLFGDKGDKNNVDAKDNGIKPSLFDAARLKLALAMSNFSLNFFGQGEEWVVACPKTRVGPGVITPCVVNGLDLIIFASRDGKRLDAFANSCPHLGSPFDLATIEQKPALESGIETESGGCVDCIVCPVHRTAFEIQSGNVRGEWCPYPPILGGIM
jgi:nitrite reductase/ring-hydroxylating ferredoxin subunit